LTKAVLLTGATGLLGGALAAHLLDARPDLRLLLLARAAPGVDAATRIRRSLARFGDLATAALTDRIDIFPGDLADPGALATVPFECVTHVVHAAIAAGSSPRARSVNVDRTLALARAARAGGRLERFVYVGSAWSCGAAARGVVDEDDAPRGEPVSDYLLHKSAAESQLANLPGLPLVIARPSLVIGHSRLGCEPSASLFWVLRLFAHLRQIPWEKRRRLDAVPVDWVAAALARLLFSPTLTHLRYHLSAGPTESVSWGDLESAFGGSPWKEEAPASLADWASSAAADPRLDAPLPRSALLACLRFLAGDAVFDDARAREVGIAPAPRLTEVLDVCLRRAGDRSLAAQATDDQS
jgi:nucleoside-diphosphate-sugar epimerase